MCNACGCSTSGLNPRQIWRSMSDECDRMLHKGYEAGTDIRFCTETMPHRFCEIDGCPRLKVEAPKDKFDVMDIHGGRTGRFTTIYRDTKRAAVQAANDYLEEKAEDGYQYIIYSEQWIFHNNYFVYFVRMNKINADMVEREKGR